MLKSRIISSFKETWYRKTEPWKLAWLRHRFEKFYGPDDPAPKVFVYTPTYNRGLILQERALKSVLSQTYKNFVYLVVGDCCTDETSEIMGKVDDPRVQYCNLPRRSYRYPPTAENHWLAGPVVAANTALSRVPNDCTWIARIDDDDIWVEDHLQSSLAFAMAGNYEFVTSRALVEKHGERVPGPAVNLYGPYFKEPLPGNPEKGYIYNPKIGTTSTLLYRSYLRFFRYNLDCWRGSHNRVNDVNLYHRLGTAGVRMGFLDKINLHYFPRPGEQTVGSEVYKANAERMEKHFAFKSQ
jgi:glycosyltransferase involved in cell wall biosynthesis